MKGKAKLERKPNGRYYVYVRNFFWQRWKPLIDKGEQISFETMEEFGKVTKIEIVCSFQFETNPLQDMVQIAFQIHL